MSFQKETIIQTYVIREILEVTGGHQSDLTSGHIKQIRDLYGMQTGEKQIFHMNWRRPEFMKEYRSERKI